MLIIWAFFPSHGWAVICVYVCIWKSCPSCHWPVLGDHQGSVAGTCGNGTLPKQRWSVLIVLVGEAPPPLSLSLLASRSLSLHPSLSLSLQCSLSLSLPSLCHPSLLSLSVFLSFFRFKDELADTTKLISIEVFCGTANLVAVPFFFFTRGTVEAQYPIR